MIDKPCDKLVIVLLVALCKHWDKVVPLLSFLQGQLAVDYDILMGTKLIKVHKVIIFISLERSCVTLSNEQMVFFFCQVIWVVKSVKKKK